VRMRFLTFGAVVLVTAAAALAALGATARADTTTTLSVMGPWQGADAQSFEAVLQGFMAANPGIHVDYTAHGSKVADALQAGGANTTDLAVLSLPTDLAAMKSLAASGTLKSLDFALPALQKNYAYSWRALGSVKGSLVGVPFEATNDSAIWYDRAAFQKAGITTAPRSWSELKRAMKALTAKGIAPFAFGAEGVSLPNTLENVYLMLDGAHRYDMLASGKIPWTGATVSDALEWTGQLVGATEGAGSLTPDYRTAVQHVFGNPTRAAMVPGGSAALPVLYSAKAVGPLSKFGVFAFPRVSGDQPRVIGGANVVVMTKTSDAAKSLVNYLASPDAATIWAKRGGFFLSPNRGVSLTSYASPAIRSLAASLAGANVFRLGIASTMPATFRQTLNKMVITYLRNPANAHWLRTQLNAATIAANTKSP